MTANLEMEDTGTTSSSRALILQRLRAKVNRGLPIIGATVEHIPPKGQQTVRYYGLYSNKSQGMAAKTGG